MHDNEELLSNLIDTAPVSDIEESPVDIDNNHDASPDHNNENLPQPHVLSNTVSSENNHDASPDHNNENLPQPHVLSNTVSSENNHDASPDHNNENLPQPHVLSNTVSSENNNVVPCNTDPFVILTEAARERGFSVHHVLGNGNCLFEAIAYQLEHGPRNSENFRENLVTFLRHNSSHYMNYVCLSVSSSDPYNADTDIPID